MDNHTASNRQLRALVTDMQRGLASAPLIYQPGNYWEAVVSQNLEMLDSSGVENFKRTVSNNYYNWLVTSLRDGQMRHAIADWLLHPTLSPLVNRLDEPIAGLRTTSHYGHFVLSRGASWRYKFFVGAIWELARRHDAWGLTDRLSEPVLGNPIPIRRRGRLISQDLANSIIEFSFIARSGVVEDGCRLAELGAGYGRLAYVFAQACKVSYCIFDIPPALAVAQWYLTSVLGRENVVPYAQYRSFEDLEGQLRPGSVAFLTPDQMELFPNRWFDCAQTISTLPEMPQAQANHYLQLIAAKADKAVFLKQWRRWRNAADDVELAEEDYVLPAPWKLGLRRVDPVQPAFINQLWCRSECGLSGQLRNA
jgi:putative sugar O-methyltransferase